MNIEGIFPFFGCCFSLLLGKLARKVPKIHYVCRSAMHMAGISEKQMRAVRKTGGVAVGVVCSSISNTKLPFWLGARPQQKFPSSD